MASNSLSLNILQTFTGSIFSKIIACETAKEAWETLKQEYQGRERGKQNQILNLKRDFESLRMQDDETIAKYSDQISLIVNKIRLVGEDFKDDRIVKKILVTIPERFESKISSLEESKDLSTISVAELISVLQAQEQRRAFRQDKVTEGHVTLVCKFKDAHAQALIAEEGIEDALL
ncbi:uncharacterized protein LOC142166975 [Nicotiana tabacum]|uniref:Uncharacterized protein LOC142166975 n=1 Tax=Nicotiana tabacum TaxID=4097 RepID=A0AC58SDZ9_TOBAC